MARYEEYGIPDVERALKLTLETPTYYDYFHNIDRSYMTFGFKDEITDAQRLEEYSSIYQQFRKFVGSKASTIMGMQENLDSLVVWCDDQLRKADIYPKTRVDMVYNSMKVDWLRQVRNQAEALIDEMRGNI